MRSARELAPHILIIGTLDTKSIEVEALAREVRRLGAEVVILDSSVGQVRADSLAADITQKQVAAEIGLDPSDLWGLPRGEAVERLQEGVALVVARLNVRQLIDGAVCIGGAGVHLAGPAFQQLPFEMPKLLVSPLASGSRQFEPFVGISNVIVMHSVVDIAGLNHATTTIYRQAAGCIVGASAAMLSGDEFTDTHTGLIAVSMNGNTTPAIESLRVPLSEEEFGLVAFHANGVGGRAMERMIESGAFVAVLDFTTTELGGAEFGGLMDPGPDRMESAGRIGLPQVLVPGCLDFITTGRYEAAVEDYPGRILFRHNPELTLVRMTSEEMAHLGRVFAHKANAALGPTTICIPTEGLSIPGGRGGPFWDPEADRAFVHELTANLNDNVGVRFVDAHINDEAFVTVVLEELAAVIHTPDRTMKKGPTMKKVAQ